jgi:putative ABC transport system permease protein
LLRHYLRLALRNLRRSPVASAINVITLALGLACFVIASAFVTFWQRAEDYFPNADRIAVLTMSLDVLDGSVRYTDAVGTPEIAASYIKAEFPRLERIARAISFNGDAILASGDQAVRRKAVAVDSDFLEIFALPFIVGDARGALAQPMSAVVTQDLALRLWGSVDAVGRTLRVQNTVDVAVTGVIASLPEPTHMGRSYAASLPFEALVSHDVLERVRESQLNPNAPPPPKEDWLGLSDAFTYLLLPHDGSVTVATLRSDLPAFTARHMPKEFTSFAKVGFGAIPVRAVLGKAVDGKISAFPGKLSVASVLMGLGALVLVVACVNYANLATARAVRRIREVGVRKTLGARPAQIMAQHLCEAALLTGVAFAVAVLVFVAFEPPVARLVGADIGGFVRWEPRFWAKLLAATLAATALAGMYPAFVLAKVVPLHALRAARGGLGPKALAALLVGGQFAVATFLLIAVTITTLQNRHLLRTGLGAGSDPLVMIGNPKISRVATETLRAELARVPQVKGLTEIGEVPWQSIGMTAVATTPGMDAIGKGVMNYGVGFDFFSVFDIPLLAGRSFSADRYATDYPAPGGAAAPPSSEPRSIVVDRAFVQQFGFASPEAAVDQLVYFPESTMKPFGFGAQPLRIIGVADTKQFAFFGPKGVHATMYQYFPEQRFHIVRIAKDDIPAALDGIDAAWRRLAPNVPISRRFLDEVFESNYSTFARVGELFRGLAAIAFVICGSGLFGMATLVAGRRLPEIGVRKTLGASSVQMITMLLRGFAVPVLIANLIVWPFAYWAARSYLDMLLSPIELTPWPFVASLVTTLAIACVAVVGQTFRAALVRPVEVLRCE